MTRLRSMFEGDGETPTEAKAAPASPEHETHATREREREPAHEREREREREREPTRKRRDARHIRAVPTTAEVKVERALELFNSSDHPRTIAGIARTLGPPWAHASPDAVAASEVTIVVAWELSWYRYRIDLGDADEPILLLEKGDELAELEEPLREWNALADDNRPARCDVVCAADDVHTAHDLLRRAEGVGRPAVRQARRLLQGRAARGGHRRPSFRRPAQGPRPSWGAA
jgi:hypothetical protein